MRSYANTVIATATSFFFPALRQSQRLLAFATAFITLLSRAHPFRATAIYALGATLATMITIFAIGPGHLPPIVFPTAALFVSVAVFVGAAGGVGIRSVTRPSPAPLPDPGMGYEVRPAKPPAPSPQEILHRPHFERAHIVVARHERHSRSIP
jgi:hypothetical protein